MTVVIFKDAMGAPQRLATLRKAWPHVEAVCPPDMQMSHARRVTVPAEWLPAGDAPMRAKMWHKADAFGHAAALGLRADFYWFIESDAAASAERWRALILDHEGDDADLVCNALRERAATGGNPWWGHSGTPDWCDCFFLMPVFRLSARALLECVSCAEEMRETFAEVALASVIRRAGLRVRDANARQTHWNQQTLTPDPKRVLRNPRLINHPIKHDSFLP